MTRKPRPTRGESPIAKSDEAHEGPKPRGVDEHSPQGAAPPAAATPQAIWRALNAAREDVQALPGSARDEIRSIIVAGSLVRGDFIPGRSDVDVYTVLAGDIERAWEGQTHRAVRECFERHFAPMKRTSLNPFFWDDVCISESQLPPRAGYNGRHRFKAFGAYLFDFVDHHRILYGRDVVRDFPAPVDPRTLVPERAATLAAQARELVEKKDGEIGRLVLLAGSAVVALAVACQDEPSLHKDDITRSLETRAPDFPARELALGVWRDYLTAPVRHVESAADLPRDVRSYVTLIEEIERLLASRPGG